jgi:virginiamycin B lyase
LTHIPKEIILLGTVRYAAGILLAAGLLAACGKGTPITSGTATPPPASPPKVVGEYTIGGSNNQPAGLVPVDSTSTVWFTESGTSRIGTLNTTPAIVSTPTPTNNSNPQGIASGPNGLLWFTEANVAKIGQIALSTTGFTEFTLGNKQARPQGITLGSDGNMWVTDPGTDSIWRINQVGAASQFPIAAGARPLGITNGPDGALWFTEPGRNRIGRISIEGTKYTEYGVKSPNSGLEQIVEASDNALWFTESTAKKLGRIQVSGQLTNEFPLSPAKSADGLVQGIDGNFYFTDPVASTIGQFNVNTDVVKTFPTITANAQPTALSVGISGEEALYFTETAAGKIGKFFY